MKKENLPFLSLFIIFSAITFIILHDAETVKSDNSNYIVLSEIQTRGIASASDEFIELYNPTASSIDLTGWRLTKKATATTSAETNLIASMSGSIEPHKFFLITSNQAVSSPSADLKFSSSVADDNSIYLRDSNENLIDKFGALGAIDPEGSPTPKASSGQSYERKANTNSTAQSMTNGADELAGNGEDTDNNANDFILRDSPQPQSAQANSEPVLTSPQPTSSPSATPSITPSPTSSPSVTPSATPSATPLVTPTPTPSTTPTPAPTVSPTPTASPTPSVTPAPTASPSASPSATATPTPSPIITPSPSSSPIIFPLSRMQVVCQVKMINFNFRFYQIQVPFIMCTLQRI
jgi:hypothetical protein